MSAPRKFLGMTVSNRNKRQAETVGFQGNQVTIPELTKSNAETLKTHLLSQMKKNPMKDPVFGL